MTLLAILVIPLLGASLCWFRPLRKYASQVTMISSWAVFALVLDIAARVLASGRVVGIAGWFEADGLSALVLLLVSFVCSLACVFARGYMRHGHDDRRLWWFYANYNLFAFAMLAVPCLAGPNLTWVAVELVTLFGALLVGFDNTASSLEAAWKFAVLTIMGAPIALFGFFALFWAYHSATGGAPRETWDGLCLMAGSMDPSLLRLSFLLVFVGFGAKSGLAPMHTWLPDAHSQAPTPVCAVLSGVKTTVPLYVILRFLGIVLASPTARVGNWMIVLGLVSVGIAAFLLVQVRDYKRMFAFSTVEHMGIILTAAGMASQAADFGAVSQILNHAITKSLCFYVAGVILLILSTREIVSVRGLLRISPFAGGALLFCSLAIAGAPPFPIFLSELSILSAGVESGHKIVVAILATLIVIAFVAILSHVNRMVLGKPETPALAYELPASCRFTVWAAAVPVLVLGVYIPTPVHSLLQLAAHQLGGR